VVVYRLFPSEEEYVEHIERTATVPKGESVKYSKSRTDPVYYVVNQLGIRPYFWQAQLLDNLALGKNTLVNTSRQVGKTTALAWFALWACDLNTLPMDSTKKTRIVFVSKSEGQSMKVISDIREFMRLGDEHVHEITKGKVSGYFTNKIAKDQNASNTKSIITFKNGCQIISLPPTDSARGFTGSQLFIDEVAYVPDEVITKVLLPIVSATGNRVSCTSTPNGRQGWFYKMFDPDDERDTHEFERLWVPYTAITLDDPARVEMLDGRHKEAYMLGEERDFAQEYLAEFTASAHNFFDSEEIDACVDPGSSQVDAYDKYCDMGIDFGKKVSRTVISISALERTGEGVDKIRLLYLREYGQEKGLGEDLLSDVTDLLKRFNIQRIVVEDCPQSAYFQQYAINKGWPMTVFNPTRDKARKYSLFKAWLRKEQIVMPRIPELLKQMYGLIMEETPRTTKIYHGNGLRDDCIDSFVMSCFHFTEEERGLRVWDF
jgi:hypothetical protein